jgi:hypothetical protein
LGVLAVVCFGGVDALEARLHAAVCLRDSFTVGALKVIQPRGRVRDEADGISVRTLAYDGELAVERQ